MASTAYKLSETDRNSAIVALIGGMTAPSYAQVSLHAARPDLAYPGNEQFSMSVAQTQAGAGRDSADNFESPAVDWSSMPASQALELPGTEPFNPFQGGLEAPTSRLEPASGFEQAVLTLPGDLFKPGASADGFTPETAVGAEFVRDFPGFLSRLAVEPLPLLTVQIENGPLFAPAEPFLQTLVQPIATAVLPQQFLEPESLPV